ncbi:uncharacterized protein LOC143028073 [Oratosquilla oratoria]|uniref:uncharacterized protein LOC143028073 n=1 Tax=Oratosquilla oratoria TaxID=337810 RepID=UPI003F76CEBD
MKFIQASVQKIKSWNFALSSIYWVSSNPVVVAIKTIVVSSERETGEFSSPSRSHGPEGLKPNLPARRFSGREGSHVTNPQFVRDSVSAPTINVYHPATAEYCGISSTAKSLLNELKKKTADIYKGSGQEKVDRRPRFPAEGMRYLAMAAVLAMATALYPGFFKGSIYPFLLGIKHHRKHAARTAPEPKRLWAVLDPPGSLGSLSDIDLRSNRIVRRSLLQFDDSILRDGSPAEDEVTTPGTENAENLLNGEGTNENKTEPATEGEVDDTNVSITDETVAEDPSIEPSVVIDPDTVAVSGDTSTESNVAVAPTPEASVAGDSSTEPEVPKDPIQDSTVPEDPSTDTDESISIIDADVDEVSNAETNVPEDPSTDTDDSNPDTESAVDTVPSAEANVPEDPSTDSDDSKPDTESAVDTVPSAEANVPEDPSTDTDDSKPDTDPTVDEVSSTESNVTKDPSTDTDTDDSKPVTDPTVDEVPGAETNVTKVPITDSTDTDDASSGESVTNVDATETITEGANTETNTPEVSPSSTTSSTTTTVPPEEIIVACGGEVYIGAERNDTTRSDDSVIEITISSPGYEDDEDYPEDLDCEWIVKPDLINCPAGALSTVFRDGSRIRESPRCKADYISISRMEAGTKTFSSKYCGNIEKLSEYMEWPSNAPELVFRLVTRKRPRGHGGRVFGFTMDMIAYCLD